MFGNLVESQSHTADVRRTGAFFILTLGSYALILLLAAVASVYAYNAQLELTTNDALAAMETPPDVRIIDVKDFAVTSSRPDASLTATRKHNFSPANPPRSNQANIETLMSVTEVSNKPLNTVSLPPGDYSKTPRNSDSHNVPIGIPGGNNPFDSKMDEGTRTNAKQPPPLPPAAVKVTPTDNKPRPIKSIGVVNGLAIVKPEPAYPSSARAARISGAVVVQLVIDEQGKVISAQVLSGHPLLRVAALDAARRTRFTPTLLSNVPVKVQGTMTYNFKLD